MIKISLYILWDYSRDFNQSAAWRGRGSMDLEETCFLGKVAKYDKMEVDLYFR